MCERVCVRVVTCAWMCGCVGFGHEYTVQYSFRYLLQPRMNA